MDSVTIKDRKFTFKVPSAWDGCAIFNMLVKFDIPFLPTAFGLKQSHKIMGPDELTTFLKLCLHYCFEELGGGPANVIDENGEFGISNYSAPLITSIVSQYIVFFMGWWKAENS